MVKIYYKGKIIIFDSSSEGYALGELTFYTGDSRVLNIDNITTKLEYVDRVVIIYEDVEFCIAEFEKQFVKLCAAGGVVKNSNAETLMIYRNNVWDLPKGKLEDGENIEQCAIREVVEECGIEDLTLGKLRKETQHIYPLRGVWHLKTTYWYDMSSDYNKPLVPQIEEGITEVRWIAKEEIEQVSSKSYLTIIDVIYSQ